MMYVLMALCVAAVLFCMLRFSFLLPPVNGLPVLLYHKVDPEVRDSITVSPERLERQLQYLSRKGYTSISMTQLIDFMESRAPLPDKPVMITFDDGYVNNLERAIPLLKQYGHKAVFFIPAAFIGATNQWDQTQELLMSVEQLKELDRDFVELGLHSFDHRHYGKLSASEIEEDVSKCIEVFLHREIPFAPALTYPYGGRPKDMAVYRKMTEAFTNAGIKLAFRIGNRVNRLPLKNKFEVKRISICGPDSMWTFRTKLTKGRVKQV